MNSKYLIYGLVDPRDGNIRYIGKSCSGLNRPKNHNKPSNLKANTHKVHWIKNLLFEGSKPRIVIIEEFDNPEVLDAAEQKWIAHYKSIGADLTNSDNGGVGSLGRKHKDSTKKIMSEKRKENNDKLIEQFGFIPKAIEKYHIYSEHGEVKQCTKCEKWLSLDTFYKMKTSWDGLQYVCKPCDIVQRRDYKKYERTMTDSELHALSLEKTKKMNASLTSEKRSALVSKPVLATNVETGETIIFPSGKSVEASGFKATKVSTAINKNIPYRGYTWKKIV